MKKQPIKPNILKLKIGDSFAWPLDRYSSVRSGLCGISNGNYYRTSKSGKKVMVTRITKEESERHKIKQHLLDLNMGESYDFDLDNKGSVASTVSQLKLHSTTKKLRFKTETQEEYFNVKRIV